jgi:hypothetical protein
MYGRTGLKKQLEDLCDDRKIRTDLILYLGHRAVTAPWRERYKRAWRHHVENRDRFRVYGLLIRDVVPSENDLRARVVRLGQRCPDDSRVELIAIYLSEGRIADFPRDVMLDGTGSGP